ncbi:MAG: zinc ribbon domain-containing protein [Clostridia bacterium]|nr:zinc ribbon domain-containing protein [Clostridia bacterium]
MRRVFVSRSSGSVFRANRQQRVEFCVEHMANENWPAEQVRAHMEAVVPKLNHWK